MNLKFIGITFIISNMYVEINVFGVKQHYIITFPRSGIIYWLFNGTLLGFVL